MARLTVYGASDDLIEIEGDLCDELYARDEGTYLAFSDGTVLRVVYTGIWSIVRVIEGSASYSHVPAEGEDSKNYSDRVTLEGDITWVCAGSFMAAGQRLS